MKKLLLLFAAGALLFACGSEPEVKADPTGSYNMYGAEIDDTDAIPVAELLTQMEGQTEIQAKVKGTVLGSCIKKGCWMTMDLENGEDMMVRMKDYGFFVPTEGLEGLECIVEGKAFMDTVTVEMLQHYAEDAGKSAEEIAAITEPEFALAFLADGILIESSGEPAADDAGDSEENEETPDEDESMENEEVDADAEMESTDETEETPAETEEVIEEEETVEDAE